MRRLDGLWILLLLIPLGCSGAGDADGAGGKSETAGRSSAAGSSGQGVGGTVGSGGSGGAMGGAQPTGGSAVGGAGAAGGGTGGKSGAPTPTGTIGAGPVPCSGEGGECSGTACCQSLPNFSCVASFVECACAVRGNCTVLGCDSNAACGGGSCCALRNSLPSPFFVATSCKAACEAGELPVCKTTADCPDGDQCRTSSSGFSYCS